jgi:hypothetical protein
MHGIQSHAQEGVDPPDGWSRTPGAQPHGSQDTTPEPGAETLSTPTWTKDTMPESESSSVDSPWRLDFGGCA